MKLAITGFVSGEAGSGAGAAALLVRELLKNGHEIHFFSKPTFVDPRPVLGEFPNFRFVDVTNAWPDRLRQRVQGIPLARRPGEQFDTITYNRLLVRSIAAHHALEKYEVCVWIGDCTRARIPGLPTVCCHVPVAGCDARSIIRRHAEIRRLAGLTEIWKWRLLASLRLSCLGTPRFCLADHLVVLSEWSRRNMHDLFGVPYEKMSKLPLPIDLKLFAPAFRTDDDCVRALWAGRIVPRKRLDLFLDGAALAIRRGLNLSLTIHGNATIIPGYEKLIHSFPYQERLTWIKQPVPRNQMPEVFHRHDVLVQPSEEEDFGSSPAEAQACGLPVIVGQSSGNADYLCERDIQLNDYDPESLYSAFCQRARLKRNGHSTFNNWQISRQCAERYFGVENIAARFIYTLKHIQERAAERRLPAGCRLAEFPL
jgi:glycosyltransferase involved in cell wall biosynthesis